MSGTATSEPTDAILRPLSHATRSMGGRLAVHLDADGAAEGAAGELAEAAAARQLADRVFARVEVWASRLTRHTDTSDLARLNADPRDVVPVRPTLAAALLAGREAMVVAPGLVDIALLDARLAAEASAEAATAPPRPRTWYVAPRRHESAVIGREPGIRFDLGGVGKGWIADRALRLLMRTAAGDRAVAGSRHGLSAIVDADGDMAVRTAAHRHWEIAVDDPRVPDGRLAVLRLGGPTARTWGVATSGTSIHRWSPADSPASSPASSADNSAPAPRHHLIDPSTGRPARTDVVQATVVASSALHAEAYAKAAVIAGSARGLDFLDRSPTRGAVLLLENGSVLAIPRTLALLANAA